MRPIVLALAFVTTSSLVLFSLGCGSSSTNNGTNTATGGATSAGGFSSTGGTYATAGANATGGTTGLGSTSTNAGPIDGTWTFTSATCNGSPVSIGADSLTLTVTGATGQIVINSTCVTYFTMTYSAPATVVMVVGSHSGCSASGGAGTDGDQNQSTYAVQAGTLTTDEAIAPADTNFCPSGHLVVTYTHA